jgi:hypothetical protein
MTTYAHLRIARQVCRVGCAYCGQEETCSKKHWVTSEKCVRSTWTTSFSFLFTCLLVNNAAVLVSKVFQDIAC